MCCLCPVPLPKQRWTQKMVVLLETKMVKVTQVNFSIKYL